jgi:hypothetical protein
MCIDCVLALPRIAQVDPGDGPLSEVVLSQTLIPEFKHKRSNKIYNTLMHHIVNTRINQVMPSPLFGWLEWALLPLGVPSSSFECE